VNFLHPESVTEVGRLFLEKIGVRQSSALGILELFLDNHSLKEFSSLREISSDIEIADEKNKVLLSEVVWER
jgi:hypothetical protein